MLGFPEAVSQFCLFVFPQLGGIGSFLFLKVKHLSHNPVPALRGERCQEEHHIQCLGALHSMAVTLAGLQECEVSWWFLKCFQLNKVLHKVVQNNMYKHPLDPMGRQSPIQWKRHELREEMNSGVAARQERNSGRMIAMWL